MLLVGLPLSLSLAHGSAQNSPSSAPKRLTAQETIDIALEVHPTAKIIQLRSTLPELGLGQALSKFDTSLRANGGYQKTQMESLSGSFSDEDRISNFGFGISKTFRSGTQVSIDYSWLEHNSILNPFSTVTRPSRQYLNQASFTLRQDLLLNAFGITDRYLVNLAEKDIAVAGLEEKEHVESFVLQGLQLFWDTYVSQIQLQEAVKARDVLTRLASTVRRQARVGSADTADLKRSEVELGEQDALVKTLAAKYTSQLELFRKFLKIDPSTPIELEVLKKVDAPPEIQTWNQDKSRLVQIKSFLFESSQIEKRAAQLADLPSLQLVLRGSANGIAQENTASLNEFSKFSNPEAFVGLELKWTFDSKLVAAQQRVGERLEQIAFLDKELSAMDVDSQIRSAGDFLKALYFQVQTSDSSRKSRADVVKAQEAKYRVGRIDLSQLIGDYRALFRSETTYVELLGQYQMTLNRLAALEDRLVP